MSAPFAVTVTLLSRTKTGTDAYGNDVYTDTPTTVAGAVFVPGGSSELIQGQDMVITQPTVYLPAGTDVTAIDAVTVAGVRYEVDGSPNDWTSPLTGWGPGIEVKLREVTG